MELFKVFGNNSFGGVLMTNEELAAAIKAEKDALIKELWNPCKGFIIQQARRWKRAWAQRTDFDVDDLVQSGYFAICAVVKGFDKEKCHSFISYLDLCLKTEFSKVAGCRTAAQMKEPITTL